MDILLSKVTQQAMNYAIRSGITITSGYAIRQCSRLLKNVKGNEKEELAALQLRLESKIRIISPAIDMIELIAARGNTSLESAVTLTKALRWDIQSLGVRLANAANDEELSRRGSSKAKSRSQNDLELKLIISDIKKLLDRIEDAVPLINLAITTSGVSLSTNLPSTVSPSRLLQASTFLTAGDSRYAMNPGQAVQIGPIFTLSMYMLFSGHAYRPHDEEGIRETTWKEVIHKARIKLLRIPLDKVYDFPSSDDAHPVPTNGIGSGDEYFPAQIPSEGKAYEFAYQLLIIEDLDDDRVHTFEDDEAQPGPYEDVALAGIREVIPIHEISKIFYADTGKILNIGTDGETNNPILLFKRDINAVPPRRMMEHHTNEPEWYNEAPGLPVNESQLQQVLEEHQEEVSAQLVRENSVAPEGESTPAPKPQPWRLPPNLDPEWIAFEVYTEEPDSEDESDLPLGGPSTLPTSSSRPHQPSRASSLDSNLTTALSHLHLHSSPARSSSLAQPSPNPTATQLIPTPMSTIPTSFPALRTSLSLLELLIRLTALQQFQQSSHLAITDELLNFFLSESSTTGAGGDSQQRRRVRRDARRRVGFDPYDESPIKRHGEDYQMHRGSEPLRRDEGQGSYYGDTDEYEEDYSSPGAYQGGARTPDLRRGSSPAHVYLSVEKGPTFLPPSTHQQRLRSPLSEAPSPSPLLRRSTQDNATRAGTLGRKPVFVPPVTPPGTTKSRHGALRRESGSAGRRGSPLGQGGTAETDSTLGTSPREDEA